MNVVAHKISMLSRAAAVAFAAVCVLAGTVSAQTYCDAGISYSGPCQGEETYINLDGTNSGGAGTLSFSWSSDCADADLIDPLTATPTLILYGPGKGNAASCKVYLEINDSGGCGCQKNCSCVAQCEATVEIPACHIDCEGTINGTKEVDRCGVCGGDGNSCLGCENVDITQDQFALDGNLFALRGLVNKAARELKLAARTSKDRAFAKKAKKDANKIYTEGWSLTWSLPNIVTTCTNQAFCTSTDNSGTIQSFNNASNQLNQLLQQVVKRAQKARGKKSKKDKNLVAQGNAVDQENLSISATVPVTASACTQP